MNSTGRHGSTQWRRRSRWMIAMVFALLAAVAPAVAAQDDDPAPNLEPTAVAGTPAPVRQLPECDRVSIPATGACPLESEFFTLSANGSFDASGNVVVRLSPDIPPCVSLGVFSGEYAPFPCYTGLNIGQNISGFYDCVYLDDATDELEDCPPLYQDSFAPPHAVIDRIAFWQNLRNPGEPTFCASFANFDDFGGGGNDLILGRHGDDILYGQDGDDFLVGGAGIRELAPRQDGLAPLPVHP